MAVDDRLGQPGGARREQHVERVVEGDRLELRARRLGQQRRPTRRRRGPRSRRRGRARRARAVGSAGADLGHLLAAVDRPVAVGVAADGEQDLGLDLAEARRARCARRTPARTSPTSPRGWRWRGRRRASRGCWAGRPTTRSPGPTPRRCRPARARATCSRSSPKVSSIGVARLRARDDGDAGRSSSSVPQRRARRSSAARRGNHSAPGISRVPRTRSYGACARTLEEVPDRRPEALEVVDRPAPQLVVAREVAAALVAQPVQVAPDLGRLADVRRAGSRARRRSLGGMFARRRGPSQASEYVRDLHVASLGDTGLQVQGEAQGVVESAKASARPGCRCAR